MHPSTTPRRGPLAPALLAGLVALLAAACGGAPSATSDAPGRAPAPAASSGPATGATTGTGAGTATGTAAAAPCSGAPAPARWRHVIWIWFENKPDSAVLGSHDAPYLNQLARSCSSATDYHGIAHPSLPNYIAATSGSTHGITDDAPPSAHPLAGPSLFGQVADGGAQWRSYQESSPRRCALAADGQYGVKHDPAAYYTAVRDQCQRWDVPLESLAADARSGALPAFAFVTPNLCHDTHDCPVSTGDAWLRRVLPVVLGSAAYRAGDTAVVITYDEDDRHHDNLVPLVTVAPSVHPGTVVTQRADHYSLLRSTEDALGLPPLGAAASATPLPGF